MGLNQTYKAIGRAWAANFRGKRMPKGERSYVSSRMEELQAAFQNKQYPGAIAITQELYQHFLGIANGEKPDLKAPALRMAGLVWGLEGSLEKKL